MFRLVAFQFIMIAVTAVDDTTLSALPVVSYATAWAYDYDDDGLEHFSC